MGSWFSTPAGDTFLSRAKNTSYAELLKRRRTFTIYLHRGGVTDHFHHKIVVVSEDHNGRIRRATLELDVDKHDRTKIIPKCEDFKGNVGQLEQQRNMVCTFKDLADKAMTVLSPMQREDYEVGKNDCQKFCNGFLEKVGAERYRTTPEVVAGVTGNGFVRIAISVWVFLARAKRRARE